MLTNCDGLQIKNASVAGLAKRSKNETNGMEEEETYGMEEEESYGTGATNADKTEEDETHGSGEDENELEDNDD